MYGYSVLKGYCAGQGHLMSVARHPFAFGFIRSCDHAMPCHAMPCHPMRVSLRRAVASHTIGARTLRLKLVTRHMEPTRALVRAGRMMAGE